MVMFIACAVGTAYPQNQEYKEHTVSEGETLWSISAKEIVDPFLWPKVWKENPEIKNPDLIYPGQKIRIPFYLLQKETEPAAGAAQTMPEQGRAMSEVKPEVKAEVTEKSVSKKVLPTEKKYLVDRATLIASGYIAETVRGAGEITGAPTDRTAFGKGDYAYVKTANNVTPGDQFYVIRSWGTVKHPETGARLGYLVNIVGIAEVVGQEGGHTKVKITDSFIEVDVGDLLDPYYEIEQPFLIDNPRTFAKQGYVVATMERHAAIPQGDIVYVDKGRKDGLEVGDLVPMTARNTYDIPNGTAQILSVRETTATAIIRKSEKEVKVGDRIGTE
jgi:hypothetical protein